MSLNRREFLRATGMLTAASMMPSSIARALSLPANSRTGTIKDVEHIIILMQENRSFDHYFGTLRGVRGFNDPFPVPLPDGRTVWHQQDRSGKTVQPFHMDSRTTAALKVSVLPHSWKDATGAANLGRWDQWIPHKTPLSMGYYRREDIPFQYALADAFTVCDAYFCSIHGQTNPNRLFMWAGGNDPRATGGGPVIDNASGVALDFNTAKSPETAAIFNAMKMQAAQTMTYGKGPRYTFKTYPEQLEEAGVSWCVYQDPDDNFWGLDNPAVAFQAYNEPGILRDKAMSLRTIDNLRRDVLNNQLPQVSWIAPSQSQSEHPFGSSPVLGATFIAQVLDALTAKPDVWAKTVLFLAFDENDGFFDHVPGPTAPQFYANGTRAGDSTVDTTDDIHPEDKIPYGLSVRLPMVVVSPWSKGGWVNSQVFDHTSMLRFIEARFGVTVPNITPWRRAVSGDLTSAFDFAKPQKYSVSLPDTAGAEEKVAAALKKPRPTPPQHPQHRYQEPGTRPSRALPYSLDVEIRENDGEVSLEFINRGQAGAVFSVHDLDDLDQPPRQYTVEAGKTLKGTWAVQQSYSLQVRGPNHFYREFCGSAAAGAIDASMKTLRGKLQLLFSNRSDQNVTLSRWNRLSSSENDQFVLPANTQAIEWIVPIAEQDNWYDVQVFSSDDANWVRRWSGRIETGAHGMSRPVQPA